MARTAERYLDLRPDKERGEKLTKIKYLLQQVVDILLVAKSSI